MYCAMLLNSDFTPLHFISDFDAITLFYKGRAEVLEGMDGRPSEWDETFSSPSTSIHVPATTTHQQEVEAALRRQIELG